MFSVFVYTLSIVSIFEKFYIQSTNPDGEALAFLNWWNVPHNRVSFCSKNDAKRCLFLQNYTAGYHVEGNFSESLEQSIT